MTDIELEQKLDTIMAGIARIEQTLPHLSRRRQVEPRRKKGCLSYKLRGGFKLPEIRELIIRMRREGEKYVGIEAAIRRNWPDRPELHASRSAIHRLYHAMLDGKLREYGIEPPFEL